MFACQIVDHLRDGACVKFLDYLYFLLAYVGIEVNHFLQCLLLDQLFQGIVLMALFDMLEVLDRAAYLMTAGTLPRGRVDQLLIKLF